MKKSLLVALILLSTSSLFAQVELSGYGGWLWTGSIYLPSYSGYYDGQDAKATDMGNYGARIGFRMPTHVIAEFDWTHTNFDFEYRDIYGEKAVVPVSANYYLAGGVREMQEGPTTPYGIFNIGAVNFKNTESGDNATYFATGFGFGVKHFFNDKIGIRLQARLLIPMMFGGGYFGCGVGTAGGGCSSGAYSYSTLLQGDFTGGIVLKLGE